MPNEPVAQKPVEEEKIYIMTYRDSRTPVAVKGFKHKGDLRSARNRAFKHGQIMGYKNIWVVPLISDLLEEEKSQSSNSSEVNPSTERGAMIQV